GRWVRAHAATGSAAAAPAEHGARALTAPAARGLAARRPAPRGGRRDRPRRVARLPGEPRDRRLRARDPRDRKRHLGGTALRGSHATRQRVGAREDRSRSRRTRRGGTLAGGGPGTDRVASRT